MLKVERQQEAKQRQAVRDSRTAQEQLAILATRPGKSLKETARLQKEIARGLLQAK